MTSPQRLDINEVDDITVVHFRDHKIIEDLRIQELSKDLFQLVDGDNRTKIVLNFSAVDLLSSAALGTLIKLYKKMNAKSGTLVLCCIKPEIYEAFKITNLHRVFTVKTDEADALASFA